MMATYIEMNDNYFTVGGAYCYVVLNVAFRIKSSQRADLIYDIVNNIKSHLSQPHSENIAIHVITILRERNFNKCSELSWHCCQVAYTRLQRF